MGRLCHNSTKWPGQTNTSSPLQLLMAGFQLSIIFLSGKTNCVVPRVSVQLAPANNVQSQSTSCLSRTPHILPEEKEGSLKEAKKGRIPEGWPGWRASLGLADDPVPDRSQSLAALEPVFRRLQGNLPAHEASKDELSPCRLLAAGCEEAAAREMLNVLTCVPLLLIMHPSWCTCVQPGFPPCSLANADT